MSFLLRAALVIGVLSWLALQREGVDRVAPVEGRIDVAGAALTAWDSLPEAARAAALHEGAAEMLRRATAAAPSSRDTLMESDRKPAWRGAQTRKDSARLDERGERTIP